MVVASGPFASKSAAEPAEGLATLEEREEVRLGRLVRAYGDQLWRLLRRLGLSDADADDAFQEVTLVAARRLHGVEPTSERAFLLGTALRVTSNLRRRRERRREVPDAVFDFEASPMPDPLALTEQHRMREVLDQMLDQLGDELRSVFVLYEIEGLTLKEMAALLGLPVGTVASRLRRAREQFEAHVARIEARRRTRGEP
jgi:RNA polymerase sigma-70 factor, ECF subfamily